MRHEMKQERYSKKIEPINPSMGSMGSGTTTPVIRDVKPSRP